MPQRARRRYAIYVLAGVAGLAAMACTLAPNWDNIRQGLNDFPAFYAPPRLLATGQLYNSPALLAQQQQILGRTNQHTAHFIRLPYLAVSLAPLALLPYSVAYVAWLALSAAALIVFAWLWPGRRELALVVACWFPPVAATFANAQDDAFLLLWMAIAVWLAGRRKDFGAGAVLSLCAAKPHLFLFLPVWIIARRMWRLGAGFAAGCAALLAISFLAAGIGWPAEFLSAIRDPAVHPLLDKSSLVAMAAGVLPGRWLWVFVGGLIAVVGTAVYKVSQRPSFSLTLAAAVAGGPLVAFHVYAQDYLVLLPLILMALNHLLERRGIKKNTGPSYRWGGAPANTPSS